MWSLYAENVSSRGKNIFSFGHVRNRLGKQNVSPLGLFTLISLQGLYWSILVYFTSVSSVVPVPAELVTIPNRSFLFFSFSSSSDYSGAKKKVETR